MYFIWFIIVQTIETSIDQVVLLNDNKMLSGRMLIIDGKTYALVPYYASQNLEEMNKLPTK